MEVDARATVTAPSPPSRAAATRRRGPGGLTRRSPGRAQPESTARTGRSRPGSPARIAPRSSNRRPEPGTRSTTVRDTCTSLAAGRPDEAEAVYWEDLKKNPETGWSLFGLMQALKAQGKVEEAAGIEARFRKAWKNADFALAPAATATAEGRR